MKRTLAALLVSATSLAQPATVTYQGFLVDSAGTPVNDELDLVFSLHTTPTGGTPIWSDPVSGVTIAGGFFSAELGINQADLAQDDLWMELAVAGDVLAPRQPIASAPWALLCNRAERLGGLGAAAYQARVTGTCAGLDQFVRAINADGTVVCEADDIGGGAVTSVTGDFGLVAAGSSAVTVDVNAGPGVVAMPDALALDFTGSSGSAPFAARADHDHGGQFVPQGGFLTCGPGQQAYVLDPSGNLFCDVDQNSTYGVGFSGNMLLVGTEFSLAPTLILSQLTAGSYHLTAPKTAWYTVHPAEFDPDNSGGGSYQADGSVGRALSAACGAGCGSGTLLAALNLPQHSLITQVDLLYDLQDPGGSIECYLDELDPSTGLVMSPIAVAGTFSFPGTIQTASTFSSLLVDNQARTYFAECSMYDPAAFSTTLFYGLRITYTFTEIVR